MYSPFAQFHLNIFEPFFLSPESSSDNDPPSTDNEDHAALPDPLLMYMHDEDEQKQDLSGDVRKVSAIY